NLRFDNRPGRVELRRRAARVDCSSQTKLGREETCVAQRYQQPAGVYELLELRDTRDAHASGDVVGFAVHSEVLEPLGLCVGDWSALGLDVINHPLPAASLIGNDDHVV